MMSARLSTAGRPIACWIGCFAILAMGGCSSDEGPQGGEGGNDQGPGASDWTMLGFDAQSTYFNRAETKISRDTAPSLSVAWTKDLGGNINSAPILVGDRLFVSGPKNYCFNLKTGDVIWENEDYLQSAAHAYSNGTLYAHEFSGAIRAIDPETGTMKWQIATAGPDGAIAFSSPTVSGDLVVIGGSTAQEIIPGNKPTFRGYVFAANKNDGTLAWKTFMVPEDATGASLWSSVSFEPDSSRVYAGTGNNYTEPATDMSDALIALDARDGSIQWKNQRYAGDIWSLFSISLGNPDYDFGANPIIFEANVSGTMTKLLAAGQKSGDMHVLRRDGGTEVCKRNLSPGSANGSRGIFNNGAWDGKHLLFAANGATSDAPGSEPLDKPGLSSVLFAIDPGTCDIVWERQLPGPVMAPITVANGVGFVPADKNVEAFNTDTGALLYKHTAASTVASAVTVSHGYVAFGSGIQWSVGTTGSILTVLKVP